MSRRFGAICAVAAATGAACYYGLRWYRRRRALVEACKEDLRALNSKVVAVTSLSIQPPTTTHHERRGVEPTGEELVKLNRRNHIVFVARWARAAKARFAFARDCEDTKLNRDALHRWLLAQWTSKQDEIGWAIPRNKLHLIDMFMDEVIEMAFEPTSERLTTVSKRSARKQARMEYYNERKFVEGWK